jgi:2-hydroxychromene-2-carboxylate isomerase
MGDVIVLAERRRRREQQGETAVAGGSMPVRSATFLFDLASPLTYLAAERVERLLGSVRWQPVAAEALHRGNPWVDPAARADAERRAAALHLPLVWPDRFPDPGRAALRAAAYAAEHDRGAAFTLAACRLAYCGGFDLEDPEVLAEAAAAAGLGLEECLGAAGDVARDGPLEAGGRHLLAAGADRLPAVRMGRTLICGEDRLGEASAWLRHGGPEPSRVTGLQRS